MLKNYHENLAWKQNKLVCGIDEVGRGCLFGSVVTAAAIINQKIDLALLRDSKLMSQKELIKVSNYLKSNSIYAFGIANNYEVDKYNIYNATLVAMRRAVYGLFSICKALPSKIIVDAMPLALKKSRYSNIEIVNFPKAESLSSSVAAAAILAKVYRDNILNNLDLSFPNYYLLNNKGYGTKKHLIGLDSFNNSVLHRKSFKVKNSIYKKNRIINEQAKQKSIFC